MRALLPLGNAFPTSPSYSSKLLSHADIEFSPDLWYYGSIIDLAVNSSYSSYR